MKTGLIYCMFNLLLFILPTQAQQPFNRHVNPFIGVDNNGNVLPGTSLPFSFMRLSPDVPVPHPTSGYETGKPIKGFSHTHVSGTGGNSQYGNISVMPAVGKLQVKNCESITSEESASAGYYTVKLDRYNVKVELTQKEKAGIHRYTFPASAYSHIMIDASSMIKKNGGYLHNNESVADIIDDRTVQGYSECQGSWGHGQPYRVYFYARFDKPAKQFATWNDSIITSDSRQLRGKDGGVIFSFDTKDKEQILLKVGISPLSIEMAKKNLEQQIPHWDFDRTRNEASYSWAEYLNRIAVKGGTDEQKTIFYTALYHSFVMPSDITGENPKWQSDEPAFWDYYTIWDTYRTVNPLYTLIAPDQERRIIRSLLDIYKHRGWLPDAWITGHYAMKQGGNNADVVIGDAIVKNLGGFDYQYAYQAMKDDAEKPSKDPWVIGRQQEYQQQGFCSSNVNISVSLTLEMAYNDYCIARTAELLGHKADAERYYKNALNCYHLFNPQTKFFWGKSKDGVWAEGFTPDYLLKHYQAGYFYEGTPYQYAFSVPQDMQGLVERVGGADEFLKHLDTCFDGGYYTQHNQPDIHVPYLYNYINRPDKTAERVRNIMATGYHAQRNGLPGSDDAGCMSAWYVFSAIGFFPVPGQDIYLIGSPLFDSIEISLENNKKLLITAKNNSAENIYIQSAKLNGKTLNKSWFRHSDIVNGAKIEFVMGNKPGRWSHKGQLPPSLSTSKKIN